MGKYDNPLVMPTGKAPFTVKALEVLHIAGVERAAFGGGVSQLVPIRSSAHSGFVHCEAIKASPTQAGHQRAGMDVLIDVQPQHYGRNVSGVMPLGYSAASSAP